MASLEIKASLAYFGLTFGTGFLLGAIRVPLLVPRLGVRNAELLEMPLMLFATIHWARFVAKRYSLPRTLGARAIVGGVALSLMLLAEGSMAFGVQHLTWTQFLASRDPVAFPVYLGMLALFGLMPSILRFTDKQAALKDQTRKQ